MSIYEILDQAIRDQKPVKAIYDGHERLICPGIMGEKICRKTGSKKINCLVYQYGGTSSRALYDVDGPDAHKNWRCMELEKFESACLIEGPWYQITHDSEPQTCVDI